MSEKETQIKMFCVPLAWFVGVFVSFETEQFSSELVWVLALQFFFLLEIGNSSRDQELSQRHFWVIIINNEWMLFVFVWYLRQTRTIEWKRRWIFQRSSLLSKVFMKSAELSIAKKSCLNVRNVIEVRHRIVFFRNFEK